VIQWSSDRGKTWSALGSLLKGNQATFDARSLPAGRIDLRLLVSDGFHTTRSTTVNVRIPEQAPAVCIMTPRQRGSVIAGETMRLWGAVTVPGDERVYERAKATWYIDNRRVGDGLDLFVVAPPKGRHRARLNVGVQGRRAEASAEFQSVPVSQLRGRKTSPPDHREAACLRYWKHQTR
jgi:hypothetical protein